MRFALLVLASLLIQDETPARNPEPESERTETRRDRKRGVQVEDETPARTATYRDTRRGIDLEVQPGSVVLRAPEPGNEGRFRTWKARTPGEFQQKYPDLVKKYNLEPLLAPQEVAPFQSDDLDRTMKDALRDFSQAWRREEERAQDGRPRFGLLVTSVPSALTSQLQLKEGEGVLVVDVYEKSMAANAGLKRHDIVLELDGKPVKDVATFSSDVKRLVEGDGFEMTIMREGNRKGVEVRLRS